jgi:hypothetical protein
LSHEKSATGPGGEVKPLSFARDRWPPYNGRRGRRFVPPFDHQGKPVLSARQLPIAAGTNSMSGNFHLLDQTSQALAVQQLLTGQCAEEKLAWLAAHGRLSKVTTTFPSAQTIYRFVSFLGMECWFFVDGDVLVFLGDHTTYTG